MTDDRVTITMSDGTTREVHPDTIVRSLNGLVSRAKYIHGGERVEVVFEPTREHWTPYEPWMRDVLADDARVSWIDDDNECRCDWEPMWDEEDGDLAYMRLRIHPDDAPERPAEDDRDEAGWKARHAALRADVESRCRNVPTWSDPVAILTHILDRDDERGQAQADLIERGVTDA